MTQQGLAIALLLALAAGARSAQAGEPAPQAPRFAFLDAPPPPLAELPPEPTREGEEYPRRLWEAFPAGGISTPFCRGNTMGLGHCGDSASGATLGGGLLYRVSPYIALGLDASFARFSSNGSSAGGATAAYSRASWVGLLVRGYFLDRGMLDPYVETGVGQGSAVAGYVEGGTAVRTEAAAPSLMAGAGIDFWVAPYLRVGPAATYRFAWLSDVRGCSASTCSVVGIDERGAVGSYASVSVRATIALGREM